MKNIAVIMNTDEVGGAERSLIFQLKNQSTSRLTFFVPKISESLSLVNFLKGNGFQNIKFYSYPNSLYSISRNNFKINLNIIKDIFNLAFQKAEFKNINQYDMVYLNGNKAAFLFFVKTRLVEFKGKIIWHLRDYYHSSKLTNAIWNIVNPYNRQQIKLVCNSNSVKNSLAKSPWKDFPSEVIYNPVGEVLPVRDTTKSIKVIGFVSMMAPWKGVHEIILWSKLFEKELTNIGITNIKIYSDNIYKTNGCHNDYVKQIKKLTNKFKPQLLTFEDCKSPKEIFQEIDCLIHYSLNPEPFGRVILEAFEAGVPVISTCLGGAAELVQGQLTGLQVYPHDRHGLFSALQQLTENKVKTFKLISSGIEKSKNIQANIFFSMKKILDMEEAA